METVLNSSHTQQYAIKKAATASLVSFLFLKIWSTVIIQAGSRIPHIVGGVSAETARQITLIENQGWFSRLFAAPWLRFDTVYYLEIAKEGYSNSILSAWPPIYPLLIRGLSTLGIPPLTAALVISNLAWILAAAVLFYFLAELNSDLARRVILLMTVFPTAFFLVAAYTESLFILLSVLTFVLIYREKWFWAGAAGAAATLVRFQGGLLVLPLFIEGCVWMKYGESGWKQRGMKMLMACSIIPLTFIFYISYLHEILHYPWPWQVITSHWEQHVGLPWEGIIGNFQYLTGIRPAPPYFNPIAVTTDLLMIAVIIGCLIAARKQIRLFPVSMQLYAWASILVILCRVDNQSQLMSVSRYLMDIFPVILAQAIIFSNRKAMMVWCALSLLVQSVLLVCFSWWVFVG
jgi:hypothetical protein